MYKNPRLEFSGRGFLIQLADILQHYFSGFNHMFGIQYFIELLF